MKIKVENSGTTERLNVVFVKDSKYGYESDKKDWGDNE